jgi:DNA invertase Pin-like site-specific DNA recombinase
MSKAYSYIRFSSEKQRKGDSLRRQLEDSEVYAAANGLTIDTTLKFRDEGLSAYDGANLEKGDLGKFIEAVKTGKIERGSHLLVESLDRLSRQKVDVALRMFLDLLHSGITIHTVKDRQKYIPGKINNIELISSILVLSRANEESETKADRLAKAWNNKRNNAGNRVITAIAPGWLTPKPDKKGFNPIPERVAIVQRIFREAADEGMGIDLIARRLNKEGVPTFGRSKGWHISYLWKILTSRAVLGEYQPHLSKGNKRTPVGDPIPDYFPRVIEDDLFYRAQAAREQRKKGGGGRKGDGVSNLFTGILKCGTCGGSVYIQPNRKEKAGIGLSADLPDAI